MKNNIENSSARIWTKSQLKETLRQARVAGLEITEGPLLVEIFHDQKCILRAANVGDNQLVRIDKSYFK